MTKSFFQDMEMVNVHEAKTHLSRLLERVEAGERIVIARAGKPIAILGPTADRPPDRVSGLSKGVLVINDDFDDPLPEFEEYT